MPAKHIYFAKTPHSYDRIWTYCKEFTVDNKCPNCGTVNLTEDKNCWQCGWRLASTKPSPVPMAVKVAETPVAIPSVNKETATLPVPAFFLYITFTALLVLLALFSMWQLGRTPLLQTAPNDWQGGWRPADDPLARFTLNLPPNWQVVTVDDAEFAGILAGDDKWLQAVRPLSDRVADEQLLFLAEPLPTAEKFTGNIAIVVMQSQELNSFTPNMFIQSPNKDERYEMRFGDYFDNFAKSHVELEFDVQDLEPRRRCRQYISKRLETTMVIAACSPSAPFAGLDEQFTRILDSFQQLAP